MVAPPGVTGLHPNGVIHPAGVTTAHPQGPHGSVHGSLLVQLLPFPMGLAVCEVWLLRYFVVLVADGVAVLS